MDLNLACAICHKVFKWSAPYEVQVLVEALISQVGFQECIVVLEDVVPKYCPQCQSTLHDMKPQGLPC